MAKISMWWGQYKKRVRSRAAETEKHDAWKDRLFTSFLIYCLPTSLVAVIPGVYLSFTTGYNIVGFADALGFLLLSYVTFSKTLPLTAGKFLIIGLFYVISVILIANLGYIGPGVFYLFGLTILIALILPIKYAYWSVVFNGLILSGFALMILLKPFDSAVLKEYSVPQWLAFSANLIFFSFVLVILIHHTFQSLKQSNDVKELIQKNYQNVFDYSPLPMWLFDIDTLEFLDVNKAAVDLYGYSRDEFLGMTIKDIRPESRNQQIENFVEAHRNNEKVNLPHVIHLKKNGQVIHVKIESSLFNFNLRAAKLVLVYDITKQIEIEHEIMRKNNGLKQSEADLRAIFESSIDGFVLLDKKGCIKAFNAKANEFITENNGKGDFKLGSAIIEYVATPRRSFFQTALNQALSGTVIQYDAQFGTLTNSSWIHYALTPVENEGNITGLCITGSNITARKMHEQTIEKQNAALKEISWMQSHLVRAPLTRLMSLTDLLADPTNECDSVKIIEYLKMSANDLDHVVKKITDSAHSFDQSNLIGHTPFFDQTEMITENRCEI